MSETFSKGRFALKAALAKHVVLLARRCLLYVHTTAAILLYRCIYMAIGWVGGFVRELLVRACELAESVARLAALVRARAKSSE